MYSYTIFSTNAGWMAVLGSEAGLRRITLPQASPEAARQALGDVVVEAATDARALSNVVGRLIRYFEGERVDFPDSLDLDGSTTFYREVWRVTRSIPHGERRSYAWVARELGRPQASRAVGQALGRNPFPIVVPCHRVVGSNGALCGFGGGLAMKQQLLELESGVHAARV